ncbi:MAG: stage II sporulation protein P [Clostridia bacterium]|nr:stage II sporulation protein P [Clostridia bacterium]
MADKKQLITKITVVILGLILCLGTLRLYDISLFSLFSKAVLLSAKSNFYVYERENEVPSEYTGADYVFSEAVIPAETTVPEVTVAVPEVTESTEAAAEEKEAEDAASASLTDTDGDILAVMKSAEKSADKDKKDGDISDYKYKNDGVTDSYGKVRVKNTNKTELDIKAKLEESLDLSIDKSKPAVLVYHTHTTETYQILDRDFYAVGALTRTSKEELNMVRVGKALCEELERAGYKTIHVTDIHDNPYSGAYSRSRKTVEDYLKEYPSIQITLDLHRDAIHRSDGTKIAPTAEINGKKAAQIMIISGCQEEGNGITNLPDWEYNLAFALQLQQSLEENFEGITRPLYFCPRSYNMNLTHCSLLVEMGSDANTLEEAVYSGKCLGVALIDILKEYSE